MPPPLRVIFELPGSEPPPSRPPREAPARNVYARTFESMDRGAQVRITRALPTVRAAVYAFMKTPAGRDKKFIVRQIKPRLCRVWRTQ